MCLAAGIGWYVLHQMATRESSTQGVAALTATPAPRTMPISEIRIGQRVLAHNPSLAEDRVPLLEIEVPSEWRVFSLDMRKSNGGLLRMELLRTVYDVGKTRQVLDAGRSLSGVLDLATGVQSALGLPTRYLTTGVNFVSVTVIDLKAAKDMRPIADAAFIGSTVDLNLPELGAVGPATIVAVAPCPPIEKGPGRIVTGRFRHQAAKVLNLVVESAKEPIGTTDVHPFWSEDRQAFIPAGELRIGETLRTLPGSQTHVLAKMARGPPEDVFNLEVEGLHTYYVGDQGVLVHNACGNYEVRAPVGDEASQLHHIATEYKYAGTALEEVVADSRQILAKAGVGLHGPENVIPLYAHHGKHPYEYHETVNNILHAFLDAAPAGQSERTTVTNALASMEQLIKGQELRIFNIKGKPRWVPPADVLYGWTLPLIGL
jgi:hypothetical protein